MRSRSSKSSPALSLIEGNAFSNQIVGQLEARPLEANDPMLLMLIGASQGATAGIHWAIPNPPMSTLSSRPSPATTRRLMCTIAAIARTDRARRGRVEGGLQPPRNTASMLLLSGSSTKAA